MGEVAAHHNIPENSSSSGYQHRWLFSWICQGVVNTRQFALCCGIYRQRIKPEDLVSIGVLHEEIIWCEYKGFLCGTG